MSIETIATTQGIAQRAALVARLGGLATRAQTDAFPEQVDVTCSEGLVLGLLRQGVSKFLVIFGHGSTDLGEVLRLYDAAGAVKVFNFRNEVEMAHTATALAWAFAEPCAVVTSIGPGGLQAMAGSLTAASNGVGVYHIYGDETTHGEGYNMQQVPKPQQGLYGQITGLMGQSYVLHTPMALRDAMRRGTQTVHHPSKAGPFFLMFPINTQPQVISKLRISSLPDRLNSAPTMVADSATLTQAASLLKSSSKVAFKLGGGARRFGSGITELAEKVGAAVVLSPGASGVLPDQHPQNMHVGGSKGSISGNFAMTEATTLVVIGSRAVCQSDCSGVGYPNVTQVVNINADLIDAHHYNQTIALCGDIGAVVGQLNQIIDRSAATVGDKQAWLRACHQKKMEWRGFLTARQAQAPLQDPVWGKPVLTQPAAIKEVCDFAKAVDGIKFFDAGDVQANGFQTVEDEHVGDTFTDTGASYMGFATSAVTAAGLADSSRYAIALVGDGSFMMNPQALISAVEHRAHALIVIFDNRRMAAITGLQHAQYGQEFRTNDSVAVDYVMLAGSVRGVNALSGGVSRESFREALKSAHAYKGLSVIHLPVYAGTQPEGGLGAYGSWNVGNWCDRVQEIYQATKI
ncbi:IlvB Thiamine pyrophosphate-requiring enzymes [acetolactate synthase, pyruvate dehydrogenase (cytochrome), glyoxylate carboligase, phosphonopyruvate decarboxylase] [Burkholderiales bacterium]